MNPRYTCREISRILGITHQTLLGWVRKDMTASQRRRRPTPRDSDILRTMIKKDKGRKQAAESLPDNSKTLKWMLIE